MNTNHDVISAFLDNEPFEPQTLGDALADPAGRELLIDFVLLRHVAQADDVPRAVAVAPHASRGRLYLAAAAVIVALLGGYQLGQRQTESPDEMSPPEPTRVIQAAGWQATTPESPR